MSLSYIIAFLWGIIILFSLTGWGYFINRILFERDQADWGLRAAWGAGFSLLVGGLLNLTWTITRTTVWLYLLLGMFWFVVALAHNVYFIQSFPTMARKFFADRLAVLGAIAIGLLAFVLYASIVSNQPQTVRVSAFNFNLHDDFQAYIVFPQKMLQMGALGPDPFSERRMTASLGGQSFLHTFVLSLLAEQNLHLVDSGIGLLIAVGLLIGYGKQIELSALGMIITLLLFLVISAPVTNITILVMGMAMYLALFRTLSWLGLCRGYPLFPRIIIVALSAAAVCSLKSSLIPASMLLLGFHYSFSLVACEHRRERLVEFVLAALLTGIFLLPWMISMYQSSGTLLYPILGIGYHGSVYGTFLTPASELTLFSALRLLSRDMRDVSVVAMGLLGIFNFAMQRSFRAERASIWALVLAGILSAAVIVIAVGGWDYDRFIFPVTLATLLTLMATLLSEQDINIRDGYNRILKVLAVLLVAGLLVNHSWSDSLQMYQTALASIGSGALDTPLVKAEQREAAIRMQHAVPVGAVILTRLERPFLLDFKRNMIFIADWPGAASPPPGMPAFRGGDALAEYLLAKSIRYVAYSYANEAGFAEKSLGYRAAPDYPTWPRTEAQNAFDFQNNLRQLGRTRQHIYDDGDVFVLDLEELK